MKTINKKISILLLTFIITLSMSNINILAGEVLDDFSKELAIEKLISLGVPNNEIENMTDEQLKIFSNANQISVDKKYYYVPENESQMPMLITGEDMSNAIEQYLDSGSDTQTSSGGYLEQYVYIADSVTPNKYYIAYTANWLKQPLNRKTDVFGVAVSNATVVPNSATATYKWVIDRTYKGNYQPNWASDTVDLSGGLKYDSHGVATKCKLMTNTLDNIQQVVAQNMRLSFYVTKDNSNIKSIGVSGNYMHQEATFAVTPSITAISFSVGISVTNSDKFTTMTPNPYTVLYQ